LPGVASGAEARTAAGGGTKPEVLRLMEAVVERSNMLCAYARVVKNQGAPGVDGLTVAGLKPWLQAHWAKVRQALLAGEYMPAAVRKVDIPKRRRGTDTGHRDGVRPADTTGTQSGTSTAVRPGVLSVELWLSSWTQRAPSRASGPGLRCGRQAMGRGSGLRKVLRSCESRCADGARGTQGKGRTGQQADPTLSGSGTDGRRGSECAERRDAARRPSLSATLKCSA
jgi:hypothetical protein